MGLQCAVLFPYLEMMVEFYGRSVLRQYMPAKPKKYGINYGQLPVDAADTHSLRTSISEAV